ncbi:MAG: porphobilinogen synthase [Candidatus Marinimicrobia bacterium]|nr:porphobilinogen synthase [Candidatus Neomarinimicrobiota bacterium]
MSRLVLGSYPATRLRRSRASDWRRCLVRESVLTSNDLVLPIFLVEGSGVRKPIKSLPGVAQLSIDESIKTAKEARSLGIPAIALFPVVNPSLKDELGTEALKPDNLVCRAVKEIKSAVSDIGIICDVALDPYTTHGHDGLIVNGDVENDSTVEALVHQSLILAKAGCDVIAPSDMMDGRIGSIRKALEGERYTNTMILSYAVKYASSFYGPFRDAVGSTSALGAKGKHTYQMDFSNVDEALREAAFDVAEGADLVMVKPGMPYLDVVAAVNAHVNVPVLAYQVSGEYAMMAISAKAGVFDRTAVFYESLLAFKRAGASAILTYAALDVARALISNTD